MVLEDRGGFLGYVEDVYVVHINTLALSCGVGAIPTRIFRISVLKLQPTIKVKYLK